MSQLSLPVTDIPEALLKRIKSLSSACRMIQLEVDKIQVELNLHHRHLPDPTQLSLRVLEAALFNLEFILNPKYLTSAEDSPRRVDHEDELAESHTPPKD